MKKYFILDTSSLLRLIRDQDMLASILNRGYIAISSSVLSEIKDNNSRILIETLKDKISIIDPSPAAIRKISSIARKIGSQAELSLTDITIVALAVELNLMNYDVEVVSEDFGIQNLCAILGLSYSSVLNRKIKRILRTRKKCLVCGEIYDSSLNTCPSCGSRKYRLIKVKYKN